MRFPKNVLVPTDFTEFGDAAVNYAVELAARFDATVHLLHVVMVPPHGIPELGVARTEALIQSALEQARTSLDALADRLRDKVTLAPVRVEVGDVRDTIDRVAKLVDADLVVMGTHGRRGFKRWMLGSVAESVVRTAPCPVLTVHREAA